MSPVWTCLPGTQHQQMVLRTEPLSPRRHEQMSLTHSHPHTDCSLCTKVKLIYHDHFSPYNNIIYNPGYFSNDLFFEKTLKSSAVKKVGAFHEFCTFCFIFRLLELFYVDINEHFTEISSYSYRNSVAFCGQNYLHLVM